MAFQFALPLPSFPLFFFGAFFILAHLVLEKEIVSGDALRDLPGSLQALCPLPGPLPGCQRNGNFHCDEGERGCPQMAARRAVSLKAMHYDAWWTRDLVNGM